MGLHEHLMAGCDEPGCAQPATHDQRGRRVCNRHMDRTASAPAAFARND